jgi:hypothetical protein
LDAVEFGLRAFFALVFAVSAGSKLRAPQGFRLGIEGYGVPSNVSRIAAPSVIVAEIVAVGLLLQPWLPPFAGMAWCLCLLSMFAVAQGVAMAKHRQVDCNCFGAGEAVSVWTIARTAFLWGAAGVGTVVALVRPYPTFVPDAAVGSALALGVVLLAATATLAFTAVAILRQPLPR